MNIKQMYDSLCEEYIEDIYDVTSEIIRKYSSHTYSAEFEICSYNDYGYLSYFFYDGEYSKIGQIMVIKNGEFRENAIKDRIKSLQLGNPRKIVPLLISYTRERELHKMFRKKKLDVNEWFDLSDQDFDKVQNTSIRVDEWLKKNALLEG